MDSDSTLVHDHVVSTAIKDVIGAIKDEVYQTMQGDEKRYKGLHECLLFMDHNGFSKMVKQTFLKYTKAHCTIHELEDKDCMRKIFISFLSKKIRFYSKFKGNEKIQLKQNMCVFIGPTGMGKTTFIAKLAASRSFLEKKLPFKQEKGKEAPISIRIASLDYFKVGAVEQIQKIANTLEIPSSSQIMEREDLEKFVRKGKRPEILLVDTTGKNPNHVKKDSMMEYFSFVREKVDMFLVVSANTSMVNLSLIFKNFKNYDYDAVIITKLDEAYSCAEIVSVCIEYDIPIAYIGYGQEPCDEFNVATFQGIINFLKGTRQ